MHTRRPHDIHIATPAVPTHPHLRPQCASEATGMSWGSDGEAGALGRSRHFLGQVLEALAQAGQQHRARLLHLRNLEHGPEKVPDVPQHFRAGADNGHRHRRAHKHAKRTPVVHTPRGHDFPTAHLARLRGTCKHTRTHTHIHTHAHTRTHTYTHIHTYTHTHTYTTICTQTQRAALASTHAHTHTTICTQTQRAALAHTRTHQRAAIEHSVLDTPHYVLHLHTTCATRRGCPRAGPPSPVS
jgi:hypothetical protein